MSGGAIPRPLGAAEVKFLQRVRAGKIGRHIDQEGIEHSQGGCKWDRMVRFGFCRAVRLPGAKNLKPGRVFRLDLTELGEFTLNASTGRLTSRAAA